MAILRDSKTGQGVMEGDVKSLIPIANQLGDAVIWDDVGEKFDPAAYKEHLDQQVVNLESVADDGELPKETRERASEQAAELREALVLSPEDLSKIEERIEKAQAQAEERSPNTT